MAQRSIVHGWVPSWLSAVLVVLLGVLAFSLPAGARTVTIRFLTNETDAPSIAFYEQAIAAFEALHPDVNVELEAVGTDARLQRLLTTIPARTAPDVVKLLTEEVPVFAERGYIVPLDDVVEEIGLTDFIPGTLTPVNGHYYDIPYALGNWTLWYRTDLFEEAGLKPPATWSEWLAAMQALTQDTDGDGRVDRYGFVWPAGQNRANTLYFSGLLWSAGGTYFDEDGNVTFGSPETVRALEFLAQMRPFLPPGIGSYSYGESIDLFTADRTAMAIHGGRLLAHVYTNRPDLAEVTRAIPLPADRFRVKNVGPNSYSVMSPAVGARNTEIAKEFLKFLVTGERAVAFALTVPSHLIPPLRSVQESPELLNGHPIFRTHRESVEVLFDISYGLNLVNEAGARGEGGWLVPSGTLNPAIGPIVAANLPAMVVQNVLLRGMDPGQAAAAGAEAMRRSVEGQQR